MSDPSIVFVYSRLPAASLVASNSWHSISTERYIHLQLHVFSRDYFQTWYRILLVPDLLVPDLLVPDGLVPDELVPDELVPD